MHSPLPFCLLVSLCAGCGHRLNQGAPCGFPVNFAAVASRYRARRPPGAVPYVVGHDLRPAEYARVVVRPLYEGHLITGPDATVQSHKHNEI
jgi:hypothetical protein